MLFLWCPGLLVMSYVDIVEAIQDPRFLFKRTEPQIVEVVIYVSSALLTTSSALVQLGSCESQHYSVDKCTNKQKLVDSSASLDRRERDEHRSEQSISKSELFGLVKLWVVFFVFHKFFCWKYTQMGDALIMYRVTGHLASARLSSLCSESVLLL